MSAIHESTKALVEHVFILYREAVKDGRRDRAIELETELLKVFNNTIDDNARLMTLLNEAEQKVLVRRE